MVEDGSGMSAHPDIVPGTVVTLASGGPEMTAISLKEDIVTCNWFSGETLKREDFPIRALRPAGQVTVIRLVGGVQEDTANA